MPPFARLVSMLRGRVGLAACITSLAVGGTISIALASLASPLAGLIVALLAESVCAASKRSSQLVYRFPRFHDNLVSISSTLHIVTLVSYYVARGYGGLAGFVAVVLLLLEASSLPSTWFAVNASLILCASLLEVHRITNQVVYLVFSLFPVLLATGYSIATLIYREAVGMV